MRARLSTLFVLLVLGLAPLAQAQHPHVYFDADELAALRERVTDTSAPDGWSYAERYAGYTTQAEQLLAQPFRYSVSIPDADGEGAVMWSYTLSSSRPPPHPNNPRYPPWTILSRRLQAQLEVLSFLYAVEGDPRYLRDADGAGAVDIALAVSAWSTWSDPEYSCHEACLDTAHLTMGVALLYDLAYDALTESERASIRGALISKGIFPLSRSTVLDGPPHNINAVIATALAVGGAAVHTESGATPHFEKAHASLTHFIESQGANGGALEGNTYGAYAMDTIVRAAIALERKSELTSLLAHPWMQALPRFTTAFLGTDRTSVNFGDSSIARLWSTTMFALASRGNAEAQWYLEHVFGGEPNSWLALMLARRDLTPAPPLPSPGGAIYEEIGYAALRAGLDGEPMLAMKSGPRDERVGHNHLDHNSFVVSAFGQWLAYDPGYRDYFNVPRRNYTTGTVGHNTMMVDLSISADGRTVRGGQTELAGGWLRHLWEGAAYSRVIGEAANAYPAGLLDAYTRRVYYARPDLFFVFDEVRAPAAHAYSFLLHGPTIARTERVESAGALPAYRVTAGGGRLWSFAVSSVGWAGEAPRVQGFPNVSTHTPYAEWRTNSAREVAVATAVVPAFQPPDGVVNAGFEDGIRGWTPRSDEDVHDTSEHHGGAGSGRVRRSGGTGYFYSSVLPAEPGGAITGGAWVKASGTGTVTLTPYFLRGGTYIAEPAGMATERDASTLGEWTFVAIPEQPAPATADGVRLSLAFTGDGTAYFDDAELHGALSREGDPDPRAFALGDPAAGIVVETGGGIDVGLSFIGDPRTPADTALTSDGPISEVATDAVLALVGLSAEGALERAYLQSGTWLRVDGEELVRSMTGGGYDLRVERGGGCVRLYVSQVETLEAGPYEVRVDADEVRVDGEAVAFEATAGGVRFPVEGTAPPPCVPAIPDAGVPADGAVPSDGSTSPDAGTRPPASGCGCRAAGSSDAGALWLLALALIGWRRARRSADRARGADQSLNG